ncbi:hypothetical protein M2651_09500 [Clostridium sp. SYSU_GA19001]|uniref:hypothetical protein n=1 Tax=Clostridium caldaquaticum TaxID=2940653 RepID=UPI0020774AB1|nr:hypothetical protein [Clostridium caldaquaticum]MCM8711264.1 hypothetical protein [Clostridium caldaquaticum]
MKDIQEIMLQMENLSKQIAATLNEDESEVENEIKELARLLDETSALDENFNTLTHGKVISPCSPSCPPTPDHTVEFCCVLNVPSNLGIRKTGAPKIIFNTGCLRCIVEPCTASATVCGCPVTLTVYNVKIVGCIPFFINHPITTTSCVSPSSAASTFDLCCHDCVCVNHVICTKCTEAEANNACNNIRNKLSSCVNTTVTFNPVDEIICGGAFKGLKVSGFFTLPNCNP